MQGYECKFFKGLARTRIIFESRKKEEAKLRAAARKASQALAAKQRKIKQDAERLAERRMVHEKFLVTSNRVRFVQKTLQRILSEKAKAQALLAVVQMGTKRVNKAIGEINDAFARMDKAHSKDIDFITKQHKDKDAFIRRYARTVDPKLTSI